MGTVLQIAASSRPRRRAGRASRECEIVIFPGVRIERHRDDEETLDLGHRLLDPIATGDFDGFNGKGRRPRRTS